MNPPSNWRDFIHHRFGDADLFRLSEQPHPFGITVLSVQPEVQTWLFFLMDADGEQLHDVQVCLPGPGADSLYYDLNMLAGESLAFTAEHAEEVEGMLDSPLHQGWLEQQYIALGEVHKRVVHYGRTAHPALRQTTRSGVLDRLLDIVTLGGFSALSEKREVLHPPMVPEE